MKRKTGSIYKFTINDAEYLETSDFLSFATEAPEILDEALKTLEQSLKYPDTEPGLTTLEFLLRRFEKEARSHLEKRDILQG